MSASSATRKPLGIRATPEQHSLIAEAAAREHRSVNSFVLRAALQAAESVRPRPTRDQMLTLFRDARAAVQHANPGHRDILKEFLAERRADADRE